MAENPSGSEGLATKRVKGSAYSIGASAATMVLGVEDLLEVII